MLQEATHKDLTMPRENLSATQNANDPVAPCDRNIIPIFPVRFAIKPSVLDEISQNYRNVSAEDNLHNEVDHEFRRIRQGFVYIFAKNGVEDESTRTDTQKGKWLIFRYNTEAGDSNSSNGATTTEVPYYLRHPDTEIHVGGQYVFKLYEWVDGYAAGQWKLNDSRTYPYAFVPHTTTEIEIAYSEHRWPAYFFERLETDSALREQMFTQVSLSPEETNFSAPLSKLQDLVVDFKPNIVEEYIRGIFGPLTEYADTHTGVKPASPEQIAPCEYSRTKGRIVALHDPVGRILDINERIHKNDNERAAFSLAHQYPLTTARAIDKIKHIVDDANWIKDLIYDDIIVDDKLWTELYNSEQQFDVIAKNLLNLHKVSVTHNQNYSIHKQIDFALSGVTGSSETKDLELITHASELLNQLYLGVGNTIPGSEYQMQTIAQTGGSSAMGRTINDYLKTWAKVADLVKTGVQKRLDKALGAAESFDSFLKINGPELGKLQLQYSNPEFMDTLKKLYGVDDFNQRPIKITEVEDVIKKGMLPETSNNSFAAGETNITRQNADTVQSQQNLGRTVSSTANIDTIDLQYVSIEGEFYPSAGFQEKAASQIDTRLSMAGLSAFLNFSGIYFILEGRNNQTAKTGVGQIAENTYLNLVVATGSIINDIYECRQTYAKGNFVRTQSKGLSQKLYKTLGKNSTLKPIANFSSKVRVGAISGARVSQFAGKAFGSIGVLFTAFTAYEGFSTGNKAKGWGNTIAAFGSAMLLAGALIGPVGIGIAIILIAAGLITEWFGSLNPIEEWAYKSFWGKSDFYWGEKIERSEDIDQQIARSKLLATPDHSSYAELKEFFEKEMRSFEGLFLKIRVDNIRSRGKQFDIFLPRYNEVGNPPKLSIKVTVEEPSGYVQRSYVVGRSHTFDVLACINQEQSIASIDLTPFIHSRYVVIKVHVDYTDPHGKKRPLRDYKTYNHGHKI
jgi:hypothetical protein